MRFSRRTDWELEANDLHTEVTVTRTEGRLRFDLTISNPTRCEFAYDNVLAPLKDWRGLEYTPDPVGILPARRAVAHYYRDCGAELPIDRICLTTSTSEAYSFLFRLLCDPGDEVLAARPSYPLFDFLAQLDDIALRPFPLLYDPAGGGWSIDLPALEAAITPRTRAIILVHPNNPTGHYTTTGERAAVEALCVRHGLALIVDEVFLDFALADPSPHRSFLIGSEIGEAPLTFVLSGVSKICGLPQMKVSWIAVHGPENVARVAMERLDVIADTFLSLNAPSQLALPAWLEGRHAFQEQVRGRMRANLAVLDEHLRGSLGDRLALEGGWTVVLRVPREIDGQPFAMAALKHGVLVQPGELYGLPEGRAVLSLLTPEDVWREGIAALPI